MAAECHVENSEQESRITKYQSKFPEIDEKVLIKILNERGNDPAACEEVLQAESRRQLYGSSPPVNNMQKTSPSELLAAELSRTYMRSNSAGSSGSSGRSTPVNQKPTPFVVVTKPNQTTMLAPGMVIANNGYYYPISVAGHTPQTPAHRTSPSTVYSTSSGGYFVPSTGNVTTPTINDRHQSPEYMVPTSSENAQYVYPGYGILDMDGRQLVPSHGGHPSQLDSIASNQISQSSTTQGHASPIPGSVVGPRVMTPNLPTSGSFIPIHATADFTRHGSPGGTVIGNPSPYTVQHTGISSARPQFPGSVQAVDPMLQLHTWTPETQFLPTDMGFVPANSPGTARRQSLETSTSSPETLMDECYMQACLSQQQKRLRKVAEEFQNELGRLDCLANEISERDHDLYIKKYRVAPDPTPLDVQRLADEVKNLNRAVNEVSKNIDKLDNGQGVLPPTRPDVNPQFRIVTQAAKYDRSKSMPVPSGSQYLLGETKPPLTRPLSEYHLPVVEFDLSSLSDQELEGWSMVNTGKKGPVPNQITDHVNNDQAHQWSCPDCTFFNHEDLHTCEMCGKER